jgi:hypothetical protein
MRRRGPHAADREDTDGAVTLVPSYSFHPFTVPT